MKIVNNNSKVKEIISNVENKLNNNFGTTLEEATRDELYKAGAGCIRDDIMHLWTKSRKKTKNYIICLQNSLWEEHTATT